MAPDALPVSGEGAQAPSSALARPGDSDGRGPRPRRHEPPAWVVELDDPAATYADLVGGKAAALAVASGAGLRTLPGFVVPPEAVEHLAEIGRDGLRSLRHAWARLSGDGGRTLVVRSSSLAEDREDDAMAGQFESVGDVDGWQEFLDALAVVAGSRNDAADPAAAAAPLAILVQPMLDIAVGGVLFGLDPVTGREDRLVASVVAGRPDRLVSGEVEGSRHELDLSGRVRDRTRGRGGARLDGSTARRLAKLARRTRELFGVPQDMEWAVDRGGLLFLLQSRAVTTEARGVPVGPVLGRGPVADTFPEPLSLLERDLWLAPLREALTRALDLVGAVPSAQLAASPVASAVGGHAVIDLDVLGVHQDSSLWRRLDPRPGVRRLRASWRVGRLRNAMPALTEDLLDRTDAELANVPALDELTGRQLLALLDRSREALVALHGHELLAGMLLTTGTTVAPATSVAMRVLAGARESGIADDEIVERHPVVLALVPPRIGRPVSLPDVAPVEAEEYDDQGSLASVMARRREAIRLRARWVQELTARAAQEIGRRLTEDDALETAEAVRHLDVEALRQAVWRPGSVELLPLPETPTEPPTTFRMSDTGEPIPHLDGAGDGVGAGGGRGSGPVCHEGEEPPEGSVLVVRTLHPGLAPVLARLAGLVSETGDPLAHLAILARQAGVPTVVGCQDAVDRFPAGVVVEVDGDTGRVRRTDEEDAP